MRGAEANGSELQTARLGRGLTQEQLAALAGVDVKTVRKAEQGKRLDLDTLTRLAFALQTELQRLLVLSPSETELQIRRRDAVLRWQRAWDEQSHERVLQEFHEDAVLRLPGVGNIPFSGVFRGKEEIRRAHETAWATCRTEPVPADDFPVLVIDDTVLVTSRKGVHLPDGGIARLTCVHIFRFEGELIREQHVEYDTLEFARLLQLPPQGSPESSR